MSHMLHLPYIRFVSIFASIWMLIVLPQSGDAQRTPGNPAVGTIAAVGTLVLHGGGHVSHELRTAFTQFAGGDQAKIVIVPTADVSTPTDRSRLLDWQRCHPQSVQLLHAESREEANREDFSRVLDEATGVWFSGGKQGYLVSVYENTPVIDRIKKLIDRGGVVGGTSAGAAIASTPMLIYDRMQDGFEFLPGTIIDQHFLTKGRLPRLQTALANYPNFVGFGIDEATALVVRGNQIEVLGDSTVTVCLANLNNQEQYVRALKPGDKGDLLALRQLAKSRHQE